MRFSLFTIPLCALCLAVAGCKKKQDTGTAAPAGFAVQVVAVEAKRQPISESLSLVGTLAANEMVEIKSETDGMVEEINFKEGGRVDKRSEERRVGQGRRGPWTRRERSETRGNSMDALRP